MALTASNKELEVKFYLANPDTIQVNLARVGAELSQPRIFERNLRFDRPDGSLTQNEQLLRLRRDRTNRLTYKSPSEVRDGVSARTEIEITVGSFGRAQALLEALGYQVSMIYEKFRTIYQLSDAIIALDEMPFGLFAEIEGPDGAAIQAACSQLGLVWENRSLLSYAELFQNVKNHLELNFRDLTFENFADIKIKARHLGMSPADIPSSSA